MSAIPIGGEGGDTPRRGVPAENEAVRGGGASGVREETEPESPEFFRELEVCFWGVRGGAQAGVQGKVDKLMGFGFGL